MVKKMLIFLFLFNHFYSQDDYETIVVPLYHEKNITFYKVSNPYPSAINLDRFFE